MIIVIVSGIGYVLGMVVNFYCSQLALVWYDVV